MTVQCYTGINAYFFVPPYLKFVFYGYLFTIAFILILCVISAQRRFPTGVDSRPGKILKTSCFVNKEKLLLQTLGEISFIKLIILRATCLLLIQTGKS